MTDALQALPNLEQALDRAGYCIALCNAEMTILGMNRAFASLHRKTPEEILGKNPCQIYPDFKKSVFYDCCKRTIATGHPHARIGFSIALNGWYSVRAQQCGPGLFLLIAQEISSDAGHGSSSGACDALTSLPSRHRLEDDARACFEAKESFALLILDVLRLRKFNEIYGIGWTDMFLMELAGRLNHAISKENACRVYKLSPDKFAALVKAPKCACADTARAAVRVFDRPFGIQGSWAKARCAAVWRYCEPAKENLAVQELIQQTEGLLEHAKSAQAELTEFCPAKLSACPNCFCDKKTLLSDLQNALRNREFALHYHPQIDCLTGKISGAEALVRWKHPAKGLLNPSAFLPVAEESGMLAEIEAALFRQALADMDYFIGRKAPVPVSFNASPEFLSSPGALAFYEAEMAKRCGQSCRLTLEVQESALARNFEHAQKALAGFAAKGVKIAIDDFGQGFGCFGYLARNPADFLKIDPCLIRGIDSNKSLQPVVSNLVKIAHSLGMLAVAEGVETQAECQACKKIGCDIVQGFLYGRPLPREGLADRVLREGLSPQGSVF